MADTVQLMLEEMVPELEDLEKRGLFTRKELKEIIHQRRDHEYHLKRRAALRKDFVRYIDYEIKLNQLRLLRKKAIGGAEAVEQGTADHAAVKRIHYIFERTLRKFKGDLSLWLKYFAFCKSHDGNRQVANLTMLVVALQKATTKALRLHPTVPGLWVYAAQWEFEHNANIKAARALMQRGLRMCPKSETLWHEYFRMELLYLQKLRTRRAVLGVDNSNSNGDADAGEPELAIAVAVATAIYRNAIAAVPDSLAFRVKFLELLQPFNGTQSVADGVYDSLAADFSRDEQAWDCRARRYIQPGSTINGKALKPKKALALAVKVYEESLVEVGSARMFELYVQFLQELLPARQLDGGSAQPALQRSLLHDLLLDVLSRASQANIHSHFLLQTRVNLLKQLQRPAYALDVLRTACSQQPADARVWILRLELEGEQLPSAVINATVVAKLFTEALRAVAASDASHIWSQAIKFYKQHEQPLDNLAPTVERGLAAGPSGRHDEIATTFLQGFADANGVESTRMLYSRLLALPGAGVSLYRWCIQFENTHADPGTESRVLRLFDSAADRFGASDSELWLDFCRWQLSVGRPNGAGEVYWRAMKALLDPKHFVEQYHMLQGLSA
eukprot:jgi/Chlat1/2999/Chrsp2S04709